MAITDGYFKFYLAKYGNMEVWFSDGVEHLPMPKALGSVSRQRNEGREETRERREERWTGDIVFI